MADEEKEEERIPLKTCAQEAYNIYVQMRILGFGAIGGAFIVAIGSVFSKTAGSIIAGVVSAYAGFFIYQATRKMLYLNQSYGVGKPPAKLNFGQ